MTFNGKDLRVDRFDGVFGGSWYALVRDTKTGKETEGAIRRLKLHAWLDALLIALR